MATRLSPTSCLLLRPASSPLLPLDPKYESLVGYPDGPYWWQGFVTACVWARFYQRQRRFDLARHMVEMVILYEKNAYDSQWPSQRASLETLHLQATIFWEEEDFSNAIQRYKDTPGIRNSSGTLRRSNSHGLTGDQKCSISIETISAGLAKGLLCYEAR
jgi:hypothetical protein